MAAPADIAVGPEWADPAWEAADPLWVDTAPRWAAAFTDAACGAAETGATIPLHLAEEAAAAA